MVKIAERFGSPGRDHILKTHELPNQRSRRPESQKTREVENQTKAPVKPIDTRKPEHQRSREVENQKSRVVKGKTTRKVENQKTRKPEKQNWKAGRTQISLWLPDTLVTDIKLQAVKERKKLSAVAIERLTRTVEK